MRASPSCLTWPPFWMISESVRYPVPHSLQRIIFLPVVALLAGFRFSHVIVSFSAVVRMLSVVLSSGRRWCVGVSSGNVLLCECVGVSSGNVLLCECLGVSGRPADRCGALGDVLGYVVKLLPLAPCCEPWRVDLACVQM